MVFLIIAAVLAIVIGGAVVWHRRKDEVRRLRRAAWRADFEKRWADSQASARRSDGHKT